MHIIERFYILVEIMHNFVIPTFSRLSLHVETKIFLNKRQERFQAFN